MRLAWLSLFVLGCAAPQPPCPCATAARPAAAPTCPSSATSASESVDEPMPTTCGGLALREARLVARGKGDNHPDLLAVRTRLAQCSDRTPSLAECAAVYAEGAQLEKTYGPNHPLRIANAAQKALCPAPNAGPPPPTVSTPPPAFGPPSCAAGKSACGSGPHAACCGSGETCCAGGAAGSYYCKKGKGPCPPLP